MDVTTPEAGRLHAARLDPARLRIGLVFALASAISFGLSGPLARVLIDAGWTPGAAVAVRVLGAALVLTVPALLALRGRWHLLGRNLKLIAGYGFLAVAATQLCYFYAVSEISVAVALLIEYTAPAAVVLWLWLRHGQRPGRRTLLGTLIAAAGLVLVLDLLGGAPTLTLPGVLWAFGAMLGLASFFILSADERSGLPPLVLVWSGLTLGGLVLALAGAVGVLPWEWNTADVTFASGQWQVPWWVPLAGLALITAALAYWTGVEAARKLGSRLASFLGLTEVLAGMLYAWVLLHELPLPLQLVGGVLIIAGVVLVRLGEDRIVTRPRAASSLSGGRAAEAPYTRSAAEPPEGSDPGRS
ncbi:EamA family transporter [Sediminivirga luteola]|uniref:Membrane protein n=1 Tax=Sediminivirga luteola TaxID=1774748 RepID=A0A8J2TWD2_9MICO|nr:EamA family transporter [Sediminivirga luteola]MCI2266177.1 DMT family transporter [Sediminivirga luteola]GGA08113.1 membrane protein [Sediminivirga luteola]